MSPIQIGAAKKAVRGTFVTLEIARPFEIFSGRAARLPIRRKLPIETTLLILRCPIINDVSPDSQENPADGGLKLGRVLVVDDIALNREILRAHLEGIVRHWDEAGDGYAAIALFKQHRYDAILMDIEMPELDGCETMISMRAWEQTRQLPGVLIVAVTSSDFPDDEQRIMDAGATTYLVKPVQRQALLAALQLRRDAAADRHPMANSLPRMFAGAAVMLDEIETFNEPEAISKRLHQLRGMVAVYGFVEYAERLRQIEAAVQQGEMAKAAELQTLREELRRLETLAIGSR